MIASDKHAVRAGTSLLVVDGTDEAISRKVELSISPSRVPRHRLRRLVGF